ncbi:MAG: hypothetical protein U1E76_27475 [Planctomycetota bacterium]
MRTHLADGAVVALFACLFACHAAPEAARSGSMLSQGVEPYTRTYRILVNGAHRGYLLKYEPVPSQLELKRTYETGTALIEDLDFKRVGMVAPNGSLYRLNAGATPNTVYSEYVKQGELPGTLAFFYDPDGAVHVTLDSIAKAK